MEEKALKIKYTTLLKRLEKADQYLQDENIPINERLRPHILAEYNKIIKQLSKLESEYKSLTNKDIRL